MNRIFIKVSPFAMHQTLTYYTNDVQRTNQTFKRVEDAISAIWSLEKEFGPVNEIVFSGGFLSKPYMKQVQNEAVTKYNRTDLKVYSI